MNTPSFTAEASLYKTSGHYCMAGTYRQIAGGIHLMLGTGYSPGLHPPQGGGGGGGTAQPQPRDCMWGHWCGPGCGSGNPIDSVDRCCQAHDLCYGDSVRWGYGPCSCDLKLMACVFPKIFYTLKFWDSDKVKMGLAAASIFEAFQLKVPLGCNPFGKEAGGGGDGGAGGGGGGGGLPRPVQVR